jgi:predicted dehydrogenase
MKSSAISRRSNLQSVSIASAARGRFNRRHLLKSSIFSAGALIIPSHVFGDAHKSSANERIDIGVIGAGIRGRHLIGDMPADGRVVAVCDCHEPRIDRVRKLHPRATFAAYPDYRTMIGEAKLDAVIIATPDHHHVHAAMLACQAGLDVYCEKPLSLTIREGRRLVEAVRQNDRVLQVGSQQRSMEMDRFACKFVREGGIGKVSKVAVKNFPGPLRDDDLPDEAIPDGMHWDLFCGPRPFRRYNWRLWQKDERNWQGHNWRGWDMWRDYSGHLMTNHGAHAIDMVQWALGTDGTGPVEIEPLIDGFEGETRQCPLVMRYASGTELHLTHPKGFYAGGYFYGESGEMKISRNGFAAFPRELVSDPPDPSAAALWQGKGIVAKPHLQNWLDCIKTRGRPSAPVEVGHRSISICHLANIARELGRKLHWDPEAETFPDDDEACTLLDRPRRAGWELPESI